jgi:hypothetical protein
MPSHTPRPSASRSIASPASTPALGADGQDLDAAVIAADRIAAEFARLAAHRAGAACPEQL